jgi:hypothetical protein
MEIAWVSPLRGSDRLVLLALAWRAPKGETAAAAPVSDLARLAGLSPDQTRRVLHGLVQAGVIRCTRPGGGRQAATYELIHTPLHSYATPGKDATPCTTTPGHPLHSYATPPLAQLCQPVKGKTENFPSARVRAPGVGLALDRNGITHQLGDQRDIEALRRVSQFDSALIAGAVRDAAAADPMGRAWPSKVLRLLSPPAPHPAPHATPSTPGWATCADWMN